MIKVALRRVEYLNKKLAIGGTEKIGKDLPLKTAQEKKNKPKNKKTAPGPDSFTRHWGKRQYLLYKLIMIMEKY